MGPRGDFFMSEFGDSIVMRLRRMLMGYAGVFQSNSRMLLAGQMILLSAVFVRGAMGMRGDIVKFRRPLMIFVMRYVVIACGHN